MKQHPRWNCPVCGGTFRQPPYDIGSGPELCCPHCEWCWGAEGQELRPLEGAVAVLPPLETDERYVPRHSIKQAPVRDVS